MPPEQHPLGSDSPSSLLWKEVVALRERITELEQEAQDLQIMLETATRHADNVSESLEEERNDLATMLEMTTEHADAVEDDLHEQAAAALRKSEQQLRMIVEATPAPVAINRIADGVIVYANLMMGTLFSVPAEQLLGRKSADLYYEPEDREGLMARLHEERSVDRREVQFKRFDGTPVWAEISLRLLDFNEEPSVLSALHDITERKLAEARLQQQVEELRMELDEASVSSELAQQTGTTRFENLDAAIIEKGTTHFVGIHSFRGGTGKSAIAANLAAGLAASGQRVGVIDADIQSPGLHLLLGKTGREADHTLNDFLLGNCSVHQLALDVTGELGRPVSGRLFFVPASSSPGAMAQVLSQGYEAQRLNQGFQELSSLLALDVLLVDTHAGFNEEALLTMRAVHTLVIVLRPDTQDFEGTGITVQVARKLEVPDVVFIVNQLPDSSQRQSVRSRVEQTYNGEVIAVLPQAADFMEHDGAGPFALTHPEHPISIALQHAAARFGVVAA
jgi:PAS domain S-box-containing protein